MSSRSSPAGGEVGDAQGKVGGARWGGRWSCALASGATQMSSLICSPAVASAARLLRGVLSFFSRSCHVTRFCYCSEIKCDAARSIDAAAAAGLVDSTHGEPMHAAAQRSVSISPPTYHSRHRHVAGRPGDVCLVWPAAGYVCRSDPCDVVSEPCICHVIVERSGHPLLPPSQNREQYHVLLYQI